MDHPAEEALFRFLLAATSRQENRQIVRHLLAQCPSCAATLKELRERDSPRERGVYDQAFERLDAWVREMAGPAPRRRAAIHLLSFL